MSSSTPKHRVCVVSWPLPSSTRIFGAVLACHGYGHYCAPVYDWLATVLGSRGYAMIAVEHVGHGKSEGIRGFVPSFNALVEDGPGTDDVESATSGDVSRSGASPAI